VTPISEIGEYRFKPAKISELLMHAYLDEVQPKKVAAAE
jgi:branched-chain amino acid aminotransferase